MKLGCAIVGIGAAFMAVNVAHADDLRLTNMGASQEAPWFQRFTASTGLGEGMKSTPGQTHEQIITWASPTSKWDMTINLRDADRSKTADRDEAAVSAFYHFTPRLRVGGEVSLAGSPLKSTGNVMDDPDRSAGVKLESAFKF